MITIKPHHFIDIVKLYGSGIESFIPCPDFNHDFYKVANAIISDLSIPLKLTTAGDDICKPCNRYDGTVCTDPLSGIPVYTKKESYNHELDSRILSILNLSTSNTYTAKEFLALLYKHSDIIFLVWIEEKDEITNKRNELFRKGCEKLLK
ncbi:MAG: DUF1284 domain-containing protein [Erysipelotrichaceae bacterium]